MYLLIFNMLTHFVYTEHIEKSLYVKHLLIYK